MKIKKAKFFQTIEVPNHRADNHDLATSINDKEHDIELQGNLIKITHRATQSTVYVTIFNTSYIRATDEQPDTKPAPSPKGSNKAKVE